jgi:hypothetical protein
MWDTSLPITIFVESSDFITDQINKLFNRFTSIHYTTEHSLIFCVVHIYGIHCHSHTCIPHRSKGTFLPKVVGKLKRKPEQGNASDGGRATKESKTYLLASHQAWGHTLLASHQPWAELVEVTWFSWRVAVVEAPGGEGARTGASDGHSVAAARDASMNEQASGDSASVGHSRHGWGRDPSRSLQHHLVLGPMIWPQPPWIRTKARKEEALARSRGGKWCQPDLERGQTLMNPAPMWSCRRDEWRRRRGAHRRRPESGNEGGGQGRLFA